MILDNFNRMNGDPGDAWTATCLRDTTVLRVDSDEYALNSSPFSHNAAYTALGWFYLDSDTGNYGHIIHIGGTNAYDGNTDFVGVDSDGNTLRLGVYGGSSNGATTSISLAIGQWYKCALVREDASSLKVYVELAEIPLAVATDTYTSDVSGRTAASRLQLGSYNNWPINGRIGGWRFWTSALSLADINTEFLSLTPVTSGAWASLPVNGTSVSELLIDQTANARNFTQGQGTLTTVAGPTFKNGKFVIDNNEIAPGILTASRGAVYTKKRWAKVQSSSVIVRNAISGDSFISLWLLCNPNNGKPNGYKISFSSSNWYITRVTNGVGTDIQSGSWTITIGQRITGYVNSNGRLSIDAGAGEVGNVTDTTYILGYPGVEFYTTSTLIKADDWQATGEYEDLITPTSNDGYLEVGFKYLATGTAYDNANDTRTYSFTNLPVGNGLLIEYPMGYGTVGTSAIISASLSLDGAAFQITERFNASAGISLDVQWIVFPKITDAKQILTLEFAGTTAQGKPHLFEITGFDTNRPIGKYGMAINVSTINVGTEKENSLLLIAHNSTVYGGGGNWEPSDELYASGWSTAYIRWSKQNSGIGISVPQDPGWPFYYCEIRRGEKQRKSRFITRKEIWTTQPQEPTEINWNNSLTQNLRNLWTLNIFGNRNLRNSVSNAHGVFGLGDSGTSGNRWEISDGKWVINYDNTGTGQLYSVDLAIGDANGSGSPGIGNIFSIVARVKFASLTVNQPIVGSAENGVEFRVNTNGELELLKQEIASIGTSIATISTGNWNWVAITYDGTNLNFFLNGVAAGSASNSQTFSHSVQYYLGASSTANERISNGGQLGFVGMWDNRILSLNEIKDICNNPWQIFKPRAHRIEFGPLFTHKRRRIL